MNRRRSLVTSCFTALALASCVTLHVEDAGSDSDDGGRADRSDAGAGADPEEQEPAGGSNAACSREIVASGVDRVDLLFVLDNSGSMAEEQKKLSAVLPDFVTVLTTGQLNPTNPKERPDFAPVKSLHIGVVSSDLGVNLAPAVEGCGGASFDPTAPDPVNPTASVRMMPPNNVRLDKPFGDNGHLLTSTAVAQAGIWSRPFGTTFSTPVELVVPSDPRCATVNVDRFINFEAGSTNPEQAKLEFSCIAKLGKNGCGLEQQLESAYKALAPSSVAFSRNTRGQGSGGGAANSGFLRDDAVLAVVFVSDEEDCSIPDNSSELFNRNSNNFMPGDINTRCGKPENQQLLFPISRYVDGLRALKPEAYQDRIIFAAIVGIPLAVNLGGLKAHSGKEALDAILNRQDMQFLVRPSGISTAEEEPVPVCINPSGDGNAAPARRLVEAASFFGENGLVSSVCESEYGSALSAVVTKVAAQLSGACFPASLPVEGGKVPCDVVEIKAVGDATPCDPARGRTQLPSRRINNALRSVCRIDQLKVGASGVVGSKPGWYYDDFSDAIQRECQVSPQRIAFTDGAEPGPGARAVLECTEPAACR
jgi:hypothetical protein